MNYQKPEINEGSLSETSIAILRRHYGGTFLYICHMALEAILWPSLESSVNDDGAKATGRWHISSEEYSELLPFADEWN